MQKFFIFLIILVTGNNIGISKAETVEAEAGNINGNVTASQKPIEAATVFLLPFCRFCSYKARDNR